MNRKGILVVVSGFSGVGKGTLMKLLTERYGQYALSISATTRSPRAGEEDGREYFFRTREAFEELIANDQQNIAEIITGRRGNMWRARWSRGAMSFWRSSCREL